MCCLAAIIIILTIHKSAFLVQSVVHVILLSIQQSCKVGKYSHIADGGLRPKELTCEMPR